MRDSKSPAVARTAAGMDASAGRWQAKRLYVAVVHTPREVSYVAAATSHDALEQRLVGYVRERARWQLWPGDARHVEARLAAGNADGAIRLYFDFTGERWDEERLRIEVVDVVGAR